MENEYYDGTKLLSMRDINGKVPEIYMCTTNRSGGKTTYFNRLAVNRFLKEHKNFCLLYRYKYEMDSVADKFFKDIGSLFFHGYAMGENWLVRGVVKQLTLRFPNQSEDSPDMVCGYALALNSADSIKKYSHLLSDVEMILFDEFQSETNNYCDKEIEKFISIHTSIARGQGKQVRYVPVYMISNPVSIINPYYVEMGIAERLQSNTKFLKGDGFVLESGFIETASRLQKESAFNRAFATNDYVAYSSESVYLNDNESFIDKMNGRSDYLCTINYMGKDFAIRQFPDSGIVYCDDRPDNTFKYKIAVTTDDFKINYVMLRNNDITISSLRYYFERGCFRFKNLLCKEALMKLISY